MKITTPISFNNKKYLQHSIEVDSEDAHKNLYLFIHSRDSGIPIQHMIRMRDGQLVGHLGTGTGGVHMAMYYGDAQDNNKNKGVARVFINADYMRKHLEEMALAENQQAFFDDFDAESDGLLMEGGAEGSAFPGSVSKMQGAGPADRRASRGNISEI